ncbi:MAG: hypothetical protein JW715_11950 [Sedimentisphaerales bacterium]|nr:hypothetical protein [Sedimentisphaerales bacterium]
MTRRKFIRKLIGACSASVMGVWWLMAKASPRKFVRAVRLKKYPGSLRTLGDISKQSKWSG